MKSVLKPKMTIKPFPMIKKSTNLLELVHYDTCGLNGQLTRGVKDTSSLLLTPIQDIHILAYKFQR